MSTLAKEAVHCTTVTVPFHGSKLFIINHVGEPYTPMKPIVEGMGLDWSSQFTKLKKRFSKGIAEITIPSEGGEQTMVCLALRKLAGWLNTISPNKVNPNIKENVIRYQEECDDVLYEYWTKGEVQRKLTRSRKSTATQLTPLRQTAERLITTGLGKIYPDIWRLVHQHFDVDHKVNRLDIRMVEPIQ
ncbi:phage antirepressor N-terminal domain-containing protein [Limnobaculum sp. M2-1]|uniref:phage antirepressor N-terminal domain-containing protein n=1 Tax=Limnobaculum sp. M2-1 TaxID=2855838 RepID=UPI001C43AB03|nr:phage antirepressor N-terminal domain-containing protein [Limnobaculum sp. M2-1]MBV7694030.1 phage antirepressor N-terminal domain-containing protein [Limnobaculum sp. M2-1]